MKRIFILLCSVFVFQTASKAQDFLSVPSANPSLYKKEKTPNDKIRVFEANFIYQYDTLELPFIDDFSEDHFSVRITDTLNNRLTDTTAFAILDEMGIAFADTFGFTNDTTFRFLIGLEGDTLGVDPNPSRTILHTRLDRDELMYTEQIVFPAYTLFDTLGRGSDTIPLGDVEFEQDTFQFFLVAPNPNDFYVDRSTLLNNTFAIEPPSIGVVTFDGLDEFGIPYNIEEDFQVEADEMTSVPINLGGLTEADSVYFSFFYQAQGRSIDRPEQTDSLILEFYNTTTGGWANIWEKTGEAVRDFEQLIFLVTDPFLTDGFRFRFRNYANSTGAFDQWHIDYLYLNQGRSRADTIYKDLAYQCDGPSLLEDFFAMPWFHFNNNPATYMDDSASTIVRNNFDQSLPVFNKVVIPDTENTTDFYRFPASDNSFVIFPPSFTVNFQYPLQGFEFPAFRVDTAITFESIYDVDFRPNLGEEPDFIRSNDTVIGRTILDNFYAYDDGTAEAGYGINPTLGGDGRTAYMAVEFNIPFVDTLGGIQLYFLPQTVDVRNQSFIITVWNSSLDPANIVYQRTVSSNPIYSDDNGYLNYSFDRDTSVIVNQKFFVGFQAIGLHSLNVGYDLNTNNRSKIFWSQDGVVWNNPSNGIRDGSLMLRPVFRVTNLGVGLNEVFAPKNTDNLDIKTFPNPASQKINIQFESDNKMTDYRIMDLSGRLVLSRALTTKGRTSSGRGYNYQEELDVTTLRNGIYLLGIRSEEGRFYHRKFIVQH